MTSEEIHERMEQLGFKVGRPAPYRKGCLAEFYRRIETKRACLSNDKDQLVVTLWQGWPADSLVMELEMQGAFREDPRPNAEPEHTWAKLSIYSVAPEPFFERRLELEAALVRAWEALA